MIELTTEEGREIHDYLKRRGFIKYWAEVVQIRMKQGETLNEALQGINKHPLFTAFWKLNGRDECQKWLHNQQLMENK